MSVSEYLKAGAENARTVKELCSILHVDGRQLRRMVRNERLDGIPILSAVGEDYRHGYYLPSETADYLRTIRRLRKQEKSLCKARRAITKALQKHQILRRTQEGMQADEE